MLTAIKIVTKWDSYGLVKTDLLSTSSVAENGQTCNTFLTAQTMPRKDAQFRPSDTGRYCCFRNRALIYSLLKPFNVCRINMPFIAF